MSKPKQRLGAVALVVRNYDEAKEYYCSVLGFDVVADLDQGNGKRWLVVAPPGSDAHLVLAQAGTRDQLTRVGDQTGGRVFLFLETDDFQRDYEAYRTRGVSFASCLATKNTARLPFLRTCTGTYGI